jgi:hypothetical protein
MVCWLRGCARRKFTWKSGRLNMRHALYRYSSQSRHFIYETAMSAMSALGHGGGFDSTHIHGTQVPVEEPSATSIPDSCGCSKFNYQRRLTARSGAAHSINCGHLLRCVDRPFIVPCCERNCGHRADRWKSPGLSRHCSRCHLFDRNRGRPSHWSLLNASSLGSRPVIGDVEALLVRTPPSSTALNTYRVTGSTRFTP